MVGDSSFPLELLLDGAALGDHRHGHCCVRRSSRRAPAGDEQRAAARMCGRSFSPMILTEECQNTNLFAHAMRSTGGGDLREREGSIEVLLYSRC